MGVPTCVLNSFLLKVVEGSYVISVIILKPLPLHFVTHVHYKLVTKDMLKTRNYNKKKSPHYYTSFVSHDSL